MMRLIGIITLTILGCSAWQSNQNNNPNLPELKEVNDTAKRAEIGDVKSKTLSAYCFYKMDDKYAEENDSTVIHNWLKKKSIQILQNKKIKNIFDHNGGGPNWAEWNPYSNLYVAIVYPGALKDSNEMPNLTVNGRPYKQKLFEYDSNLIWYRLEQSFWEEELRAIDSLDIEKMYLAPFLEAVRKDSIQPITDLDYGEILRFETSYQGDTLTHFFHATYGE